MGIALTLTGLRSQKLAAEQAVNYTAYLDVWKRINDALDRMLAGRRSSTS